LNGTALPSRNVAYGLTPSPALAYRAQAARRTKPVPDTSHSFRTLRGYPVA